MATTIKYKNLFVTALAHLTVQQLINIQRDLVAQTNELRKQENELNGMELTRLKNEIKNLVAQTGLVAGYIKIKLDEHPKCEMCGRYTTFTKNMCEDCFDAEVDRHYSDDEQN